MAKEYGAQRKNKWEGVNPITIDTSKLTPANDYTIARAKDVALTPDETTKIKKIADFLANNKFVYRSGANPNDCIDSTLRDMTIYYGTYLPWPPKKEVIVKNIALSDPSVTAYGILKSFHAGFDKIDDKYKPLIAASMHRMIGVDCNTPIKFLLVDVPDGIESAGKGVDFTKIGNASLSIRVAEKLGIPVLNIWDTNISTRLKALVDMLKPKETSEDDEYGF